MRNQYTISLPAAQVHIWKEDKALASYSTSECESLPRTEILIKSFENNSISFGALLAIRAGEKRHLPVDVLVEAIDRVRVHLSENRC